MVYHEQNVTDDSYDDSSFVNVMGVKSWRSCRLMYEIIKISRNSFRMYSSMLTERSTWSFAFTLSNVLMYF